MISQRHVLGIVLAGGEGKRLFPLTMDRAKPAVPFGGGYRLIDFVLSNLVNAGYSRLCVLTQYKSHSLDRHISQTWRPSGFNGEYITPVPAQQRLGPRWYTGSADAIFQSLNLVYDEQPAYIVVFGADHVYRMDPEQMVEAHIASGAECTVAGIRVPRSEATAFGCIDSDDSGRITQFLEKPADPPGTPDDPDATFASMGNYVFTADALVRAIKLDADNSDSDHDMGGDIIPAFVERGEAFVYDFKDNQVPGATDRDRGYWRDVGTFGRLLRRAHGSGLGAPDLQPVQPALAHPRLGRLPRGAGEVRQRRTRAGVDGRGGQHHLRGHRPQLGGQFQRDHRGRRHRRRQCPDARCPGR